MTYKIKTSTGLFENYAAIKGQNKHLKKNKFLFEMNKYFDRCFDKYFSVLSPRMFIFELYHSC